MKKAVTAMKKLNDPIWIFGRTDTKQRVKGFFSLTRRLFAHLKDESPFLEKRSLIGDVFDAVKNACGVRKIHKYTIRSVIKTRSLNILLLGL